METNTTAALEALAARLADALPSNHNGAGEPICRAVKILDGKRVVAKLVGWDRRLVFEVSTTGTKPLTLAEAAEELAAP